MHFHLSTPVKRLTNKSVHYVLSQYLIEEILVREESKNVQCFPCTDLESEAKYWNRSQKTLGEFGYLDL